MMPSYFAIACSGNWTASLASAVLGAIITNLWIRYFDHRKALKNQRLEIERLLRRLRRDVELQSLDMTGCLRVFGETRDKIEDAVAIYGGIVFWPNRVRIAIRKYCGYAPNHPYRHINKAPESREEFLNRLDALEKAIGIEDLPGRRPRRIDSW